MVSYHYYTALIHIWNNFVITLIEVYETNQNYY